MAAGANWGRCEAGSASANSWIDRRSSDKLSLSFGQRHDLRLFRVEFQHGGSQVVDAGGSVSGEMLRLMASTVHWS